MRDLLDALERAERRSGFVGPAPDLSGFATYRDRRLRKQRIATAALALIVAAAALGSVITVFRSGDGLPAAPSITPSNVADLKVEWKAQLHGPAAFLGNRFATDEPFAPTVTDGKILVGIQAGTLYAFDDACGSGGTTCSPTWTADVGDAVAFAPTVDGSSAFVATQGGKLLAYDLACGDRGAGCAPIWTADTGGALAASPVVSDGLVFGIGSLDPTVYAFPESCSDPCSPAWTSILGPGADPTKKNAFLREEVVLQPVVSNGIVYAVDFFDHTLHAIDAMTGKTIWVGAPTAPIKSGVRFNGPVVDGGTVYMEAGSYLYAFAVGCGTRGETCSPMWMTDKLDAFVGKPVVADGMVFVGTALNGQIGHLLAFAVDCGTDGGACTPALKVSIDGELTVEPISVADGRVFVVSNLANLVAAIPESCGSGTETCSPLWQDMNVIQPIAATTVPGLVFVNTGAEELRAYPADCADPCVPLWEADTHGAASPPVIEDGKLYVVSAGGTLYAFGPGQPGQDAGGSSDPTPLFYLALVALAALVLIVRAARRRVARAN